jgi:hypothetical protein
MAEIKLLSVFNESFPPEGDLGGTFTVPNDLFGNTVRVALIGGGGAGAGVSPATDDAGNIGGGGGGAGGVVYGLFPANAGDTITVTATTNTTRATGDGSDGSTITLTNGGDTWIAEGGTGGSQNAAGPGGSGSGSGATVIAGGDGGRGMDASGANVVQADNGDAPGTIAGGIKGNPGSAKPTDFTHNLAAGGGGGSRGDYPQWLNTALTDNGVDAGVGQDGGDGAGSSGETQTSNRLATSTVYKSFDGGSANLSPDELKNAGQAGGGAGVPWVGSTGGGMGGAGGQSLCIIEYSLEVDGPEITLDGLGEQQTNPYVQEVGAPYIEPGVNATYINTDTGATETLIVTTTLPAELSGDVVGTLGGPFEIVYTADTPSEPPITSTASRWVQVVDTTGPRISLAGGGVVYVITGTSYTDPGATARDNDGTEYTFGQLTVGGDNVNVNVNGEYIITYNLTDASGNQAPEVTRKVIVSHVALLPANSDKPKQTPTADSEISFSDIMASSQLWQRAGTTKSQLNNGNATERFLQNISMNKLRNWYTSYAAGAGAGNITYITPAFGPGAQGSSGLSTSFANDTKVATSNFYDYAPVTIATAVKAETYDVYWSGKDAKVWMRAWGTTDDNNNAYALSIQIDGTWDTQTGRGYNSTNQAIWTGLGGEGGRGVGTGTGAGPSGARDNPETKEYGVRASWTMGGETVNYQASTIKIGQTGKTTATYNPGGLGAQSYLWNGSAVSMASKSDIKLEHIGFQEMEDGFDE